MAHDIYGFHSWKNEQLASIKRICENIRAVFTFLPMSIVEVVIGLCLMILVLPFIFSRKFNRFLIAVFSSYKIGNDRTLLDAFNQNMGKILEGLNIHDKTLARNYKVNKVDVSKFEEKLTSDFISKLLPFVFGVLTTLVTLFLTDKI